MSFHASSYISTDTDTNGAASSAAQSLKEAFANQPLRAVIVYASINHDQPAVLRALRAILGPDVPILGCSSQGITTKGSVVEGGYALGAMGLGGESLKMASAIERSIECDTRAKGQSLATRVKGALGGEPTVLVLLYDPLCGADIDQLLAGINDVLECPIVGGGASQPFGTMAKTYQYGEDEVLGRAAIAIGLGGPFSIEIGVCHGTLPTGIDMVVTRAKGNRLLEIDDRPALDVWREVLGVDLTAGSHDSAAIGIERTFVDANGAPQTSYFVRGAFGYDVPAGALIVQAAIPEGTRIMVHHRTAPMVTEGTAAMARDLTRRLQGRRPWAVLGFECGARTSPFLGAAATLKENLALQTEVAPGISWLGMMAWGEIAPVGRRPAFHNFTYPLLVLAT